MTEFMAFPNFQIIVQNGLADPLPPKAKPPTNKSMEYLYFRAGQHLAHRAKGPQVNICKPGPKLTSRLLLTNLEKIGFGLGVVCNFIFNDDFKHGKCHELRTYSPNKGGTTEVGVLVFHRSAFLPEDCSSPGYLSQGT